MDYKTMWESLDEWLRENLKSEKDRTSNDIDTEYLEAMLDVDEKMRDLEERYGPLGTTKI